MNKRMVLALLVANRWQTKISHQRQLVLQLSGRIQHLAYGLGKQRRMELSSSLPGVAMSGSAVFCSFTVGSSCT